MGNGSDASLELAKELHNVFVIEELRAGMLAKKAAGFKWHKPEFQKNFLIHFFGYRKFSKLSKTSITPNVPFCVIFCICAFFLYSKLNTQKGACKTFFSNSCTSAILQLCPLNCDGTRILIRKEK